MRAGEGNESERLAILEAHRADVVERMRELERNLDLIDYKLGIYRGRLGV